MIKQMSSFDDIKFEDSASALKIIAEKIQNSKHLTSIEQKNIATELRVQEWESSKQKKIYSYFVLAIICLANMGAGWQDGLIAPAYNYDYSAVSPNMVPYYWIGSVIGDTIHFSTINGTAVIVPLLLSSFVAGILAEKWNRKWLYLVSLGLCALCTLGIAFSGTYIQVFGLTMFYGFLEGLSSPALISLITEYFPQNRKTSAFAIFHIISSLASSLGALTTIFIGLVGWRMTYGAIGAFFAGFCVISLFIIREPKRF